MDFLRSLVLREKAEAEVKVRTFTRTLKAAMDRGDCKSALRAVVQAEMSIGAASTCHDLTALPAMRGAYVELADAPKAAAEQVERFLAGCVIAKSRKR